MTYQVFARKYRPQTFDEVMGQDPIVRTLKNAITLSRIHHATLFCGARGVGKTSLARIFAKSLNCEKGPTANPCQVCASCVGITQGHSMDVLEIDGASHTGVDDIRELREQVKYLPTHGKYRIYIIDEVHMLSKGAFNALLKTLEEPPEHVLFMFATTEPHKIPVTILSRCQRFDLKRLSVSGLVDHLRKVIESESVVMPDQALELIAQCGDGSVRDSLSLLDQVVSFCGQEVTAEQVSQVLGLADKELVFEALQAILEEKIEEALGVIHSLYRRGGDLKIFCESLCEQIRNLVVLAENPQPGFVSSLDLSRLEKLVVKKEAPYYLNLFGILSRSIVELARSDFPRFVMEMAFVKMIKVRQLLWAPQLLASMSSQENREGAKPVAAKSPAKPPLINTPQAQEVIGGSQVSIAPGENSFRDFVRQVSDSSPQIASVLEQACVVEFGDEKIKLGFEEGSIHADILRDRFEKLETLVFKFFGKKVPVVLTGLQTKDSMTLFEIKNQEQAAKSREIKERALGDLGVKKAQELLGARLVEVKEVK